MEGTACRCRMHPKPLELPKSTFLFLHTLSLPGPHKVKYRPENHKLMKDPYSTCFGRSGKAWPITCGDRWTLMSV